MIEVTISVDPTNGDRLITGIVPAKDLAELKLSDFDRLVLDSPEESAADVFQSLELLARRQLEQQLIKLGE